MTRTQTRSGFTLPELLVAMSIIAALTAIVLLSWPGINSQEQVRAGVEVTTSTLKSMQGMAARDRDPRGVRFVVDPNKPNPLLVTELQLIELPPPIVANKAPNTTLSPLTEGRVEFYYAISNGVTPDEFNRTPVQPYGTIVNRVCVLRSLTANQASQIVGGCTLLLPTLETWHKITSVQTAQENPPNSGLYDKVIILEVYPDAHFGAARGDPGQPPNSRLPNQPTRRIFHFAVHGLATPLMGEKIIPMPTDICIDLSHSLPQWTSTTTDFDVIFAPSGQMVNNTSGQVFLTVRNFAKVPTLPPWNVGNTTLVDALRLSGEMYAVGIRNGSVGAAPITWPDLATGQYTAPQNPFFFAQKELSGQ